MQSQERNYVTINGEFFRLIPQGRQASSRRDAVNHLFYVDRLKENPIRLRASVVTSGLVTRSTGEDILERVCVNRIREALDKGELDFNRPQEPSDVFQELEVDSDWLEKYRVRLEPEPSIDYQVREFIAQKVYWLGYIAEGMKAKVRLDDLADWEYLKVDEKVFKRNIEFLEAEGILSSSGDPFLVQPTTKLVSTLEQTAHRLYPKENLSIAKEILLQKIRRPPAHMRLKCIKIQGYRPFKDLLASLGPLEIFVGANGSGKSSLFEFLKFLRDSMYQDIPPEIIPGSMGQQIFHKPGPDLFSWRVEIDIAQSHAIRYEGELLGPVGSPHIPFERVQEVPPKDAQSYFVFMNVREGLGDIQELEGNTLKRVEIALRRPNQMALSTVTNPAMTTLYNLREYIRAWRFYSAFNIANDKIRKPVPTEQEPVLHEDAGNLSSVLHYLMTEHQPIFDDLQQHLRSAIPGFKGLTVKARGGPGQVIAFWQEDGVDSNLSLADLSDGILRLMCWTVLCVQPNPPSLICIDEPDQGVHPRTLPLLAGLLEKACDRTQVLIATHTSYFLAQFLAKVDDISRIAVMRKENGEARFIKPKDSRALVQNLEDFGPEEIEIMHRSDELELLP
jgi:predicted ATPase